MARTSVRASIETRGGPSDILAQAVASNIHTGRAIPESFGSKQT